MKCKGQRQDQLQGSSGGGDSVGDEQCKGRVNQPLQDGVIDPGLEDQQCPVPQHSDFSLA